MRRSTAVLAVAVLVSLVALAPAVSASDEFVVRLPDADDADGADDLLAHAEETQEPVVADIEARDGKVVRRFWLTNAVLVRGDDSLRASLAERDDLRVHDNYEIAAPAQNETDLEPEPDAWADAVVKSGVEQVNATAVWDGYDTRGEGVSVAVLDTGVDVSHPDVELTTTDADDPRHPGGWAEFDMEGERVDSTPYDSASHGTHVSGTVAGGNESGTWIGVAPEADLMHAKVFGSDGGSFARILAGMEWAVENDAEVLSLSFGVQCDESPVYVRDMVAPVRNAQAAGSFVVASTGNDGADCSSSPGNIYDSLAVGAVDGDRNVPRFSSGASVETKESWGEAAQSDWNWPPEYIVPDVTAPGVAVLSAVPDGGYERMDGTSMATPHVAGVAALVESSTERDVTPAEHRFVLLETATKPGGGEPDTRHGVGVVDAYHAAVFAQDAVEMPDMLPVDLSLEDEDDDADAEEEPSTPLPGFGVVAVLAAVLFAAVLRKTTCSFGDTG